MAAPTVEHSSRVGSFRLKLTLIRYASLVMLALLVGAGAVYYSNVSNQKSYLTERNFRLLATLRDELNDYLINYEKVLRAVALGANRVPDGAGNSTENNENNRGGSNGKEVCLEHPPGAATVETASLRPALQEDVLEFYSKALCDRQLHPRLRNVVVELRARSSKLVVSAKEATEVGIALAIHGRANRGTPLEIKAKEGGAIELTAESTEALDQTFQVSLRQAPDGAVAQLDFTQPLAGKFEKREYDLHIVAEVKLQELLDELPTEKIFADLLIADENGLVLFEKKDARRPSALEFTSLDVLFAKELPSGEKTASLSSSGAGGERDKSRNAEQDSQGMLLTKKLPALQEIQVGGAGYLLFAQPAILPFGKGDIGRRPAGFIVGGLVRTSDFWKEALALSTGTLLLMVFLTLAVLFLLPVLKLRLMGPKDHFSMADALIFMFFPLMGTALITVGLLDHYLYTWTEDKFDRSLEVAAVSIRESFEGEQIAVIKQLNSFDSDRRGVKLAIGLEVQGKSNEPSGKQPRERYLDHGKKLFFREPVHYRIDHEGVLGQHIDYVYPYPYFDQVFWVGRDGWEQEAWFKDEVELQMINLEDRPYVQHVWKDDLRMLDSCTGQEQNDRGKCSPPKTRGWLQSIRSWTTGKPRVIAAIPSRSDDSGVSGTPREGKTLVAAIETHFWSLTDPALPNGFGFAVIDQAGLVLFHSDKRRALNQNFLLENDQNRRLRSLVYARQSGYVDSKYEGRDQRLYVLPLMKKDGMPWTLVVYRNQDILRTVNLEALFFAMFLFSVYAVIVLAGGLFGFLIAGSLLQDRGEWMWPDSGKRASYISIAIFNVLLMVFFAAAIFSLDLDQDGASKVVALGSVACSVVGMVMMYLVLTDSRKVPVIRPSMSFCSGRASRIDFQTSYAVMVASCLILFAAVPAGSFLAIAYDEEMKLLIQHAGKGLEDSSQARVKHLKNDYDQSQDLKPATPLLTPERKKRREELVIATSSCLGRGQFEDIHGLARFGMYPEFMPFGSSCEGESAEGPTTIDRLHELARVWYNDESEEIGGFFSADKIGRPKEDSKRIVGWKEVVEGNGEFSSARWSASIPLGRGLLIMVGLLVLSTIAYAVDTRGPGCLAFLLFLGSLVPLIVKYEKYWIVVWYVWAAALALAVQYYLPRFISQRVFLLGFENPAPTMEIDSSQRRILILVPPGESSASIPLLESWKNLLNIKRPIEIDAQQGQEAWFHNFESREKEVTANDLVVLFHFEHKLGEPDEDRIKLEWLEELAAQSFPCRVAIVSTVDPFRKHGSLPGERSEIERQRWARALEAFQQVYQGAANDDSAESEKTEANILDSLDRNRPRYESIWAFCSDDEQLALFQLAKHRFLHSKNSELRSLMRKGLVTCSPDLRLMNESFRRFVLDAGEREGVEALERQGPASAWNLVSRPVSVGLLTVMIFLLSTQEQLRTVTMAFLTILPAFFATFPRLFAGAQTGRITTSSNG